MLFRSRTKALWDSVFAGPKALIKRGDWIDQPSVGIPYLYVATGLELTEVLRDNDPPRAQRIFTETKTLAKAVHLEQAIAGADQVFPQISVPSGDSARGKVLPSPPPTKAKQR